MKKNLLLVTLATLGITFAAPMTANAEISYNGETFRTTWDYTLENIEFDYSIGNEYAMYDSSLLSFVNFSDRIRSNWSRMTVKEKTEHMQDLVNSLAYDYDISDEYWIEVVTYKEKFVPNGHNIMGYYKTSENRIYMNETFLFSYEEVVSTLAHETWHAKQLNEIVLKTRLGSLYKYLNEYYFENDYTDTYDQNKLEIEAWEMADAYDMLLFNKTSDEIAEETFNHFGASLDK